MSMQNIRKCPLCGNNSKKTNSFPYKIIFNGINFNYYKCRECKTVYVDPVPDEETFALLYAKDTYHDGNYNNKTTYSMTGLLDRYLDKGSTILDYGCGLGDFLLFARNSFIPFGVEFDSDAANFASKVSSCKVWTSNNFFSLPIKQKFDAIYLGDVLEHLPDPEEVIRKLFKNLKPGGVLFVEGPLEANISLVYLAALIFGRIKRVFRPDLVENGQPHHLFRANEKGQINFFKRTSSDLVLKHWMVYETGWPYIEGGIFKKFIAKFAIILGGKSFFGMVFGNRFKAIFVKK